MSRSSIKDYIARKSDQYLGQETSWKHRLLTEVCSTTGFSRKYVINLLNGNISYRERKGRGATYTKETKQALLDIWQRAGCPCAPYLKADMDRWIREYNATVSPLPQSVQAQLMKISERTISRMLVGATRIKPGWSRANSRSGRNQGNLLKKAVPVGSGETIMACCVPPGDIQVDTFACGGGDPSDNFFWMLTMIDRKTQWLAISPAWNRGQHATVEALKRNEACFPFPIQAVHSDNGGEFINHHFIAHFGKRYDRPYFWRSRPSHSNDNAHVEEKNRSAGRELFGEQRLDCRELEKSLIDVCKTWTLFCDFYRPCKMLIAKVKRPDRKGYSCKYDKPRSPYIRLLEEGVLDEKTAARLKAFYESHTGMELLNLVCSKMKKIRSRQDRYNQEKRNPKDSLPIGLPQDSPLRGAPSGTSLRQPDRQVPVQAKLSSKDDRTNRRLSAEYLANQKPPDYLSGTLSI